MTPRQKPETERPLQEPLQVFDLDQTVEQLRSEHAWTTGRNAITLRKAPGLQVVLLAMQAGDRLHDHRAPGPITVQPISGRIHFITPDQTIEVRPHAVVALDAGITHAVEAIEDAVCLVTIGGTAG